MFSFKRSGMCDPSKSTHKPFRGPTLSWIKPGAHSVFKCPAVSAPVTLNPLESPCLLLPCHGHGAHLSQHSLALSSSPPQLHLMFRNSSMLRLWPQPPPDYRVKPMCLFPRHPGMPPSIMVELYSLVSLPA